MNSLVRKINDAKIKVNSLVCKINDAKNEIEKTIIETLRKKGRKHKFGEYFERCHYYLLSIGADVYFRTAKLMTDKNGKEKVMLYCDYADDCGGDMVELSDVMDDNITFFDIAYDITGENED